MQPPQVPSSSPPQISQILSQFSIQQAPAQFKFELPSPRVCGVHLKKDQKVWIKKGGMIAYQGSVSFSREGIVEHGLLKSIKEGVTGEGMTLVKATANLDASTVFLADDGKKVMNMYLQPNETVCINGKDVLCFEDTVKWDVKMIKSAAAFVQGGLFNVSLSGPGFISVTTEDDPLVLWVTPDHPVCTDPQNTVMWSDTLTVSFVSDFKLKAVFGRSSGEEIQMKFEGKGFVLVQPVERTKKVQSSQPAVEPSSNAWNKFATDPIPSLQ